MQRITVRAASSWAVLGFLLGATGCVHHRHFTERPDFQASYRKMQVVGILQPVVKIYELDAGGTRILKDEWSQKGRRNVTDALASAFEARSARARLIEPKPDTKDEIEEVRLLYEAVASGILQAINHRFLHKYENFDYTVGAVGKLLDRYGVDTLALAYGTDEISTGGRTALAVAWGILGGHVRGGVSVISLALIDRAGHVLWFDMRGAESAFDLRDPKSASRLVEDLVYRLGEES